MTRTLIAGFGNVLRGDDGFGVEVVRRLEQAQAETSAGEVCLMEIGTGGIRLAQELLTPYDRLIVVDAMTRGGPPGSVYVLQVDGIDTVSEIDMHMAVPACALSMAKTLGALPREVFFIGCEPLGVDELTTELSPQVQAAVDTAIAHVRSLLAGGER